MTWVYPTTSGVARRVDDHYLVGPIPGRSFMYKEVVAAANGTVVHVVKEIDGDPRGKRVVIRHDDGTATIYGNLSIVRASYGKVVQAGQPIGNIGGSGAIGDNDYPARLYYRRQEYDNGFPTRPFGDVRKIEVFNDSLQWDEEPPSRMPTDRRGPIVHTLDPTDENIRYATDLVTRDFGSEVVEALGAQAVNDIARLVLQESRNLALSNGIFPERLDEIGRDYLSNVSRQILGDIVGPQIRTVLSNVSRIADIAPLGPAILTDLSSVGNVIVDALPQTITSALVALGQAGAVGNAVFQVLGTAAPALANIGQALGSTLAEQLGNRLNIGGLENLGNILNSTTALTDVAGAIGQGLGGLASLAGGGFQNLLSQFASDPGSLVGALGARLGEQLSQVGNIADVITQQLPNALAQIGPEILGGLDQALGGLAGNFAEGIGGALSGLSGGLEQAFGGLAQGLSQGIGGAVQGVLNQMGGGLQNALGEALGGALGGLQGLAGGVGQVAGAFGQAAGALSGILGPLGQFAGPLQGALGQIGQVAGMVQNVAGIVGNLGNLGQLIPSLMGQFAGQLMGMAQGLLGKLMAGFAFGNLNTVAYNLKEAFGSFPDIYQFAAMFGGPNGPMDGIFNGIGLRLPHHEPFGGHPRSRVGQRGGERDAGGSTRRSPGRVRVNADFDSLAPRIMDDLQRDFGLTRFQAAGIVGNLAHESAGFTEMQELRPVVPGSRGGYGWMQWTGPRRRQFEAWVAERGLDINSYEANYGFMVHELRTTERRSLEALRRTRNADEATIVFEDKNLRAGVVNNESRLKYTDRALEADRRRATTPSPAAAQGDQQGSDSGTPRADNGTAQATPERTSGSGEKPQPEDTPPAGRGGNEEEDEENQDEQDGGDDDPIAPGGGPDLPSQSPPLPPRRPYSSPPGAVSNSSGSE